VQSGKTVDGVLIFRRGLSRELDVILLCDGFQLVVGGAVILHHALAEGFHVGALCVALGEAAHRTSAMPPCAAFMAKLASDEDPHHAAVLSRQPAATIIIP